MAYKVLARKWRPGRFSELVGQEHVVSAITNALQNDRLHHAYLFTGTRGVGKTTIARIFSKSLNCEQGQSANPCGQCATCQEIEHGNYVDLLEIDAASRTKVEDTREVLDNVQYKPTRGRFKVYLIDEVHMLSKNSFNALLKTLEEPPPHVKFLLATTDPQKLPITVLSRCLQFNLKALSREQISQQLHHILEQEAIAFESPALGLLARAAQGSMRDALSLTDQAIAQGNNQVTASVVTDMLGLMDRQQVLKLLFAIVKREATAVFGLIDDIAMMAPDYSQVLAEVASILHQIALTQWVPETCKLETTSAKAIYQLSKMLPAEHVQLVYQLALQGRKDLPFAGDGRSAFEMTILRMMTFAPVSPIDDPDTVITHPPSTAASRSALSTSTTSIDTQAEQSEAVQAAVQPQEPSDSTESDSERQTMSAPEATAVEPSDITSTDAVIAIEQQHHVESEVVFQPDYNDEQMLETQATQLMDEADDFRRQSQAGLPDEHMDYPPPDVDYGMFGNDAVPPADEANTATASSNQPEPAVVSTADMLAWRQRLKQQAKEDKASAAKKPLSSAPDISRSASATTALEETRPINSGNQQSHDIGHAPVSHVQADDAPALHSVSEEEDTPPPWVTEDVEPLLQDSVSSQHAPEHTASNSLDTPFTLTDNEPEATTVDSNSTSIALPANAEFDNELPPYLENGDKLVHAQQIDKWSALVETMPIAGLIKQIALNSRFTKRGDDVTMTLDSSQAHLVNDSTVPQLTAALNQVLSKPVSVKLVYGDVTNTPYQIQQQIIQMRKRHAKQVIQQDETLLALIDAFNAEVVQDSIEPR